jgi:hypothetical protein
MLFEEIAAVMKATSCLWQTVSNGIHLAGNLVLYSSKQKVKCGKIIAAESITQHLQS